MGSNLLAGKSVFEGPADSRGHTSQLLDTLGYRRMGNLAPVRPMLISSQPLVRLRLSAINVSLTAARSSFACRTFRRRRILTAVAVASAGGR